MSTNWSYTADHDRNGTMTLTMRSAPQSVTGRPQVLSYHQIVYPPTPHMPYISLPGHPTYIRPPTPDLFPIDLTQNGLLPVHATLLSDEIPPSTTVSVFASNHHLLFYVKTGSWSLTTADFVLFMQHLVQHELPPYNTLPPNVQQYTGAYFMSRHGSQGFPRWERFVAGHPRFGVPTGVDLLLGNTSLYGLDSHLNGVWVATLYTPPQ
ncbi:hypothetical protein B0H10DRAFT_335355 [Mycena sp. CBHHK59/15]|nr:hypothetical protein B0H10DRAFT_335355 [Mycena sp. CBHHK59/15]